MINYKEDKRKQKRGYAPGNYINICPTCKEKFLGDKRAFSCADCAYDDSKWMEKSKIKQYMSGVKNEFVDNITGELNYTLLAEDTADHFNLYESDGYTILDYVFEIAIEVEV